MKNWKLFLWAFKRLDIDDGHCKKNMKNNLLLWLMDMSGVTYTDVLTLLYGIDNELKRRAS